MQNLQGCCQILPILLPDLADLLLQVGVERIGLAEARLPMLARTVFLLRSTKEIHGDPINFLRTREMLCEFAA